jgi:hypothetical protein
VTETQPRCASASSCYFDISLRKREYHKRSLGQLLNQVIVVLRPVLVFAFIVAIAVPVLIAMALMVAVSFPLPLHFAFSLAISITILVSLAFAIPVSISVAITISFTVSVAMPYGVPAIPGLCSNGKTSNSAAADGED